MSIISPVEYNRISLDELKQKIFTTNNFPSVLAQMDNGVIENIRSVNKFCIDNNINFVFTYKDIKKYEYNLTTPKKIVQYLTPKINEIITNCTADRGFYDECKNIGAPVTKLKIVQTCLEVTTHLIKFKLSSISIVNVLFNKVLFLLRLAVFEPMYAHVEYCDKTKTRNNKKAFYDSIFIIQNHTKKLIKMSQVYNSKNHRDLSLQRLITAACTSTNYGYISQPPTTKVEAWKNDGPTIYLITNGKRYYLGQTLRGSARYIQHLHDYKKATLPWYRVSSVHPSQWTWCPIIRIGYEVQPHILKGIETRMLSCCEAPFNTPHVYKILNKHNFTKTIKVKTKNQMTRPIKNFRTTINSYVPYRPIHQRDDSDLAMPGHLIYNQLCRDSTSQKFIVKNIRCSLFTVELLNILGFWGRLKRKTVRPYSQLFHGSHVAIKRYLIKIADRARTKKHERLSRAIGLNVEKRKKKQSKIKPVFETLGRKFWNSHSRKILCTWRSLPLWALNKIARLVTRNYPTISESFLQFSEAYLKGFRSYRPLILEIPLKISKNTEFCPRAFLREVLNQSHFHNYDMELNQVFITFKIVHTKQPTIYDLYASQTRWNARIKNEFKDQRLPCTCNLLSPILFDKPHDSQKCISVLMSNTACDLRRSAKTKVNVDISTIGKQICKQVTEYAEKRKNDDRTFLALEKLQSALYKTKPKKSEKYRVNSIHKPPTIDEFRNSRILKELAVVELIDKNPSQLSITCPRQYQLMLERDFLCNSNYELIHDNHKTEKSNHIKNMKQIHNTITKSCNTDNMNRKIEKQISSHRWDRFGSILKIDQCRYRPLASYYNNGLKLIYSCLCSILGIMLIIVGSYDVISFATIKQKYKKFNARVLKANRRKIKTRTITCKRDISNFYNTIPRGLVQPAFNWLIQRFRKEKPGIEYAGVRLRREIIKEDATTTFRIDKKRNIINRKPKRVKEPKVTFKTDNPRNEFSQDLSSPNDYILWLPIALLSKLIFFDLDSIFGWIGNILCRQKTACAQGSPCSPGLATLIAAFIEFNIRKNLPQNYKQFIVALEISRWVDDIYISVCLRDSCPKQIEEELLAYLTTYKIEIDGTEYQLPLKVEDDNIFVGMIRRKNRIGQIFFTQHQDNYNAKSIQHMQKRLPDFFSERTSITALTGAICTACDKATRLSDVKYSLINLFREYLRVGTPYRVIKAVLANLSLNLAVELIPEMKKLEVQIKKFNHCKFHKV